MLLRELFLLPQISMNVHLGMEGVLKYASILRDHSSVPVMWGILLQLTFQNVMVSI